MQGAVPVLCSGAFVMLWSSGWIVSRFAVQEISAMTLLSLRYLIVTTILVAAVSVLRHWRRLDWQEIKGHLLVGILSHATYLLAGVGAFQAGASAALVAFITALQPLITAALAIHITREQISLREAAALLIGLAAVGLLVSDGYRSGLSTYALILPVVAVVSLSIGTLLHRRMELTRKLARKPATPITLILLIHSLGSLTILLPLTAANGQLHMDLTPQLWCLVLWLALVVSLGAFALMFLLLRYMSAMRVSSLAYLVPPATMLQAFFVFGDAMTVTDWVALSIAALSVYLIVTGKTAHRSPAELSGQSPFTWAPTPVAPASSNGRTVSCDSLCGPATAGPVAATNESSASRAFGRLSHLKTQAAMQQGNCLDIEL